MKALVIILLIISSLITTYIVAYNRGFAYAWGNLYPTFSDNVEKCCPNQPISLEDLKKEME